MGRAIRIALKSLALIAAYAVIIAVQFVGMFSILFNMMMNVNGVPGGLRDCLLYAAGLVASLAVPLHYLLRRKLAGFASFLSVLEAFLLAAPSVCAVIFMGGIPTPFFASETPGLMIYQGVVMLVMLIVPTVYALFYLYLVIVKGVSASKKSAAQAKGRDKRRQ